MDALRYLWVTLVLLSLGAAACSGSGSSGFDISAENAAIDQAIAEQRCIEHEGLAICPADATPVAAPSSSPTATPTPTHTPDLSVPTATTAPANTVSTATATAIATRTSTVAAPHTATPTRVTQPSSTPAVDTELNKDAPIVCLPLTAAAGCSFTFSFRAQGFPDRVVFRVAVRNTQPTGPWTIGAEAVPGGAPGAPDFETPIAVAVPVTGSSAQGTRVQLAVLVFVTPPAFVPAEVERLGDSGADFAFVTGELTLRAEP